MPKSKPNPYIPNDLKPWPHELRVAKILADAGYIVEFLPTGPHKTADILLDGIEFEIKTPEKFNPNTLDHTIRRAIRQSPNLIIDTSRLKYIDEVKTKRFLVGQAHKAKMLKRMLMLTNHGQIIDIFTLV